VPFDWEEELLHVVEVVTELCVPSPLLVIVMVELVAQGVGEGDGAGIADGVGVGVGLAVGVELGVGVGNAEGLGETNTVAANILLLEVLTAVN